MKKKTSSILLLSAFAALVLAGCNNTPDAPKSSAAESLESSVTSEPTEDTSSIASETPSSAPASSSSQAASSSSAPASSSRPASSSSAPASSSEPQRNVWEGQAFVGEYKCGNDTLTILDDGTTKWAAETTARPATLTTANGVHHIVSAATVAAADKLDIYTDGTMAYVVHGTDKYILDKNASASSYRAFSALEDNTKMFGGILISEGNWKYFASVNGTFHFGITVSMVLGSNINAGGAVFEATIAGAKTTFKVTEAASDTKEVATIEAYNITATRYAGDNGELVIAKTEADEVDFISLAGSKLLGASLVGDVVSLRTTATPTYEKTDKGVEVIYETTTYTLDQTAKTYVAGQGQDKEALFHALTGNTGSYQTTVGADGNLWATFTPAVTGVLHITETIQVPTGGYSGDDTYIVIYEASSTTNYGASSGTTNGVVLNEDDNYDPIDSTLTVEANKTYVIKVGAYNDRNKSYSDTGSTMAGETEAIEWVFTPDTVETYTGELGDLVISKRNGNVSSITVNGEALTGYTMEGNNITLVASSLDTTVITAIVRATVTTTITIDPEAGTYTSDINPVLTPVMQTLTATSTSFSGATDETGNAWAMFTPAADGIVNITETGMGTITDSYLAVYDLTALGDDLTKLKSAGTNAVKYSDAVPAVIADLTVIAGHHYVIKHGAFVARDILLDGKTTTSTYIGSTMSYTFSYTDLVPVAYNGADGDLTVWYQGGQFHHATLGEDTLANVSLEGDVLTMEGTPVYENLEDTDATTITKTDTVFTLDSTAHSYAKTNPSTTSTVMNALTDTSTGLSGYLGADGNLWASFTPTTDGFINIEETVQATNGTSHDTLLAVYEKKATGAEWSNYASYSSTYPVGSLKALNAESAYSAGADNLTNPVYVRDLPVEAGKTYVIKIGAYGANNNYPGNPLTGASYLGWIGAEEAFSFRFDTIINKTYTGADGDLEVETLAGRLRSAKLAGTTLNADNLAYDHEAGTLNVTGSSTYNTENPIDPIEIRTDKAYTLNAEEGTYTVADAPVERHIFSSIAATDTSFAGVTDNSGNTWATFTATADGAINIEETAMGAITDTYLAVYDLTALNNDLSKLKSASTNASKYSDANPAKITNMPVVAGHTYVIKHGAYAARDTLVNQKTTTATFIGTTISYNFAFAPYTLETYAGANGDLVVTKLNGAVQSIKLNGEALTGATLSDDGKTITKNGAPVLDFTDEGLVSSTTLTTYTLSGSAYTVASETNSAAITTTASAVANDVGTYNLNTGSNGLALVKFTAPADGQYTITALITGVDNKLGVYSDVACTTFASGTNAKDSAMSGSAETLTITATAGQVFYIKTCQYGIFSNAINSTSTTTYSNKAVTITIA